MGIASGGVSVGSIVYGAGQTTSITLGTAGNGITIYSGITVNNGAGAQTISSPITLGGSQTWTNNSANAFAVNATTLARTNEGTLNFAGTGAFTTTTLANDATGILAGPWVTFSGNQYATVSLGNITAYTGTTAEPNSWTNAATNYEFTTTGTTTLTASRTANTVRYSGSGQVDISLGASGANTLTLNGLLNAGTGTSPQVTLSRSGSSTGTVVIGSTNEIVFSGPGTTTVTVPITGGGGKVTVSAGRVNLTAANTYTGNTAVNGGTLALTSGGTINSAGTVSVAAGATFGPGFVNANPLTLNGGTLLATTGNTMGTGGTVTLSGGNVIHTFLNTGANQTSYTLNLPTAVSASVLVLAGGGGGGSYRGGGGGAGGLIYYGNETPAGGQPSGTSLSISAGDTSVLVGKGGDGALASAWSGSGTTALKTNTNGFNSTLGALTATGGGSGGYLTVSNNANYVVGNAGGSGGGGGGFAPTGTAGSGGLGTTNQGYAGGNSANNAGGSVYPGGGGGGAGGVGGNGVGATNVAGAGGAGLTYSISGSATTYAGGGGGGRYVTGSSGGLGGLGGSGVGGNGATGGDPGNLPAYNGANAVANTGSGGGGGGNVGNGGNGSAGVVIVSYAYSLMPTTLSGTITVPVTSTLDAYGATGQLTVASNITGAGGLNIASSNSAGGIVIYGVAQSYAGDTTINANGNLQLNVANALPTAGNTIVKGTLNLNGNNTAIGGTLSGIGTVNGGALATINGTIRGGIVNGSNDYGTLTVNNVNVSIASTAKLAASAGNFGGTPTASLLNLTGSSTFTAASGFTIDLLGDSSDLVGQTYTITLVTAASGAFDVAGNTSGTITTGYTLNPSNFANTISSSSLIISGNNLNLSFTTAPVPEPHHVLLICVSVLLVGWGIRRNRIAGKRVAAAS